MKRVAIRLGLALMLLALPPAAAAQEHGGGGGGGGGGCGDVFGDLIHVLRDPVTGQPILQKRLIEYPQDIVDWGYCPVALDANGGEIPFADLSCDVHPDHLESVLEVDYFGRLNGGRTKQRNSRMHFNEVIDTIKLAGAVSTDETGRLKLGYDCTGNNAQSRTCVSWQVVDSPMSNLALYARVLTFGHLQTDPLEVDTWAHGDPAAGTQYHPALGPEDWAKFPNALRHLLPRVNNPPPQTSDCFGDDYPDGFNPGCAAQASLTTADFLTAASVLGGAANKTGWVTVDLVSYLNRILKIPIATDAMPAALGTLPALIRDENGEIAEAGPGLPAPADERFVDFGAAAHVRSERFDHEMEVLRTDDHVTFTTADDISLLGWLAFRLGAQPAEEIEGVDAFVTATNEVIRSIQFIHEYAVPADLGWDFEP